MHLLMNIINTYPQKILLDGFTSTEAYYILLTKKRQQQEWSQVFVIIFPGS